MIPALSNTHLAKRKTGLKANAMVADAKITTDDHPSLTR